MKSFCSFCGARSLDEKAHFCSDCGGKLEQSAEAPSSKKTLSFPVMEPPNLPVVILSNSFVDLIKQEQALSKETSPIASVEFSKSFLASISEAPQEDPMFSRDTLREVPALPASSIPTKGPIITLPDFLEPIQNLSEFEPLGLPAETPPAPVLKLSKIASPALEPHRDTLPDAPPARREPLTENKPTGAPIKDEPSVLLSTSLEAIILNETIHAEPETETKAKKATPATPEAFPEVFSEVSVPKAAFPKIEAPQSILLAEPASIVSKVFLERLAKATPSYLFATSEAQQALRSRWVQVLLVVIVGPLLVRALEEGVWLGFSPVQPLFVGLLVCLLFFRLLAEERQPLWPSMTPLLISYVLTRIGVELLLGHLGTNSLLRVVLLSMLLTLIFSGSLGVCWLLAPRLRILAQPIDGLLLGIFCGAGCGVGFLSQDTDIKPLELLFAEILCGGLAGYFWGLAWYKASERKSFIAVATLGIFGLQGVLLLLFSWSLGRGSLIPELLLALLLLLGYLVLFGYAIKLKQLECT
jgi:hypothetical protein